MASNDYNLLLLKSEHINQAISDFNVRLDEAIKMNKSRSNSTGKSSLETISEQFSKFRSDTLLFVENLKRMVENNSKQIDNLENYSRRNCLLFHGIVETENENVDEVKDKILDEIEKLKIPNWEAKDHLIDWCHRLGRQKSDEHRNRPIIVRFVMYNSKREIWKFKKNLKGTKVMITESLSRIRLMVFKEARLTFGVPNTWTFDCNIFVRMKNGKVVKVQFMDQLKELNLRNTQPNLKKVTRSQTSVSQKGG